MIYSRNTGLGLYIFKGLNDGIYKGVVTTILLNDCVTVSPCSIYKINKMLMYKQASGKVSISGNIRWHKFKIKLYCQVL